jgi:hypothetical protein
MTTPLSKICGGGLKFYISNVQIFIIAPFYRRDFIHNAHLLMKIVYPMWTATEMTETEVEKLSTDIRDWRTDFREKYSHLLKSKCNHEKFHMLVHVPEDIRRSGLPGNHCSHTWEQYQRVVKAAAVHTNNRHVRFLFKSAILFLI